MRPNRWQTLSCSLALLSRREFEIVDLTAVSSPKCFQVDLAVSAILPNTLHNLIERFSGRGNKRKSSCNHHGGGLNEENELRERV